MFSYGCLPQQGCVSNPAETQPPAMGSLGQGMFMCLSDVRSPGTIARGTTSYPCGKKEKGLLKELIYAQEEQENRKKIGEDDNLNVIKGFDQKHVPYQKRAFCVVE